MRKARTDRLRRIGAREAEELLTGVPTGAGRDELVRLLAAAAAPGRPHELAGESAAVAAFSSASRQPPATLRRARPAHAWTLTRAVAVKVAAGVAALFLGVAALAAETGHLPTGAQQRVHDVLAPLGVPAPNGGGTGHRTPPRDAGNSVDAATSGPDQGAATAADGPPSVDPSLVGPCQKFVQNQKKHRPKPLDPATLNALTAAAGTAEAIPAFCAKVLGSDQSAPPGPDSQPGVQPPTTPNTGDDGDRVGKHGSDGLPAAPGQGVHPHPSAP